MLTEGTKEKSTTRGDHRGAARRRKTTGGEVEAATGSGQQWQRLSGELRQTGTGRRPLSWRCDAKEGDREVR